MIRTRIFASAPSWTSLAALIVDPGLSTWYLFPGRLRMKSRKKTSAYERVKDQVGYRSSPQRRGVIPEGRRRG